MPYPLIFKGEPIPGIILNVEQESPEPHFVRTHYHGLNGESEIRCGLGGRSLRFDMVLFDGSITDAEGMNFLLRKFDRRTQEHGILQRKGLIFNVWHDVTFIGCRPWHEPIPDDARTLVAGKVVYHVRATLLFHQVSIYNDRPAGT